MTKVAGEAADGMLVHGFTTERYLREVTLPAVAAGLAARNLTLADFEMFYPAFVVTGNTEEEMAAAAAGTRKRIAFYASTPAYRGVLDLHGWGDLHVELNALSKQMGRDGPADQRRRAGRLRRERRAPPGAGRTYEAVR
jgi:hypothetical protein